MGIYRTAMGKTVDMGSLIAKNEKTRAVGNVKNLNARGDTIDGYGRVIKPVTEKVNSAYAKTVGNRSAQPTQKVAKTTIQPDEVIELTPEERELENSLEDDLEIEKIKEEEIKKASKKK